MDRSPVLHLSQRVDRLERVADGVAEALSALGEDLGLLGKALDAETRLERNNRNWLIVFCVGALTFASYVTLVNTPMGMRVAGSVLGEGVTTSRPAAVAASGVAGVRFDRETVQVAVDFSERLATVPVVVATPQSADLPGAVTASVLEVTTEGFTLRLHALSDHAVPPSRVEVHWAAFVENSAPAP